MEVDTQEKILIEQLKSGSEKAYKQLFDDNYELLISYAGKYLSSKDSCREVVQEMFINLYQKRDNLNIRRLKPYLLKSIYHACLQEKRSFHTVVEVDESDLITDYDVVDQAEREAAIWKTIDQLPDRCREIFVYNRFEGLPNQEIADKLGISKRTVETQISIALKSLRDKLLSFIF